jgi:hypothetical protein
MVYAMKVQARNEGRAAFLEGCPEEYNEILTCIDSLTFTDIPPYEKIVSSLEEVRKAVFFID